MIVSCLLTSIFSCHSLNASWQISSSQTWGLSLPTSCSFAIGSSTTLRIVKYQIHWHLSGSETTVTEEGAIFLQQDSSSFYHQHSWRNMSAFVNTALQDSRRLLCPAPWTSEVHPLNLAVGTLPNALVRNTTVLLLQPFKYSLRDNKRERGSWHIDGKFQPKLIVVRAI